MNYKLALCGFFCVVVLSGCSSPPKLPEPTGAWEDINLPVKKTVQVKGVGINEKTK